MGPYAQPKITNLNCGSQAPTAAAWNPDGTQVVIVGQRPEFGAFSVLFDTDGNILPSQLPAFPMDTVVAWSPDGRFIAWCELVQPKDGVWGSTTYGVFLQEVGRETTLIHNSAQYLGNTLSFSPDGRWLVWSVQFHQCLYLWDMVNRSLKTIPTEIACYMDSIVFSPCSRYIAHGTQEKACRTDPNGASSFGAVYLYDLLEQEVPRKIGELPNWTKWLVSDPKGRFILAGSEKGNDYSLARPRNDRYNQKATVFCPLPTQPKGYVLPHWDLPHGTIAHAASQAHQTVFAIGTDHYEILLWTSEGNERSPIIKMKTGNSPITTLQFSPDGTKLLFAVNCNQYRRGHAGIIDLNGLI